MFSLYAMNLTTKSVREGEAMSSRVGQAPPP